VEVYREGTWGRLHKWLEGSGGFQRVRPFDRRSAAAPAAG
jgi:hypothetical protein